MWSLPERPEVLPEGPEGLSEGSEGLSEGSEGLSDGLRGLSEGSAGLPEGPEGLPEGPEGFPEGPEGLPERPEKAQGMDVRNFFPFYRTLSPVGAATQKKKTNERGERRKTKKRIKDSIKYNYAHAT